MEPVLLSAEKKVRADIKFNWRRLKSRKFWDHIIFRAKISGTESCTVSTTFLHLVFWVVILSVFFFSVSLPHVSVFILFQVVWMKISKIKN